MARSASLPPDERRAQILAAARAVFARLGYHKAGVADIIAEVGVARGTFYNYFESKREVFSAVVEEIMDEVVGVVRPIDVTADISEQVYANLDRLIRAITTADVAKVLFAEALGVDDEGDAALRHFYGDALRRIETALRLGQTLGVVADGDVRLTARCLLGVVKEPVLQAALFGERLDPDAVVGELFRLMRHGILK